MVPRLPARRGARAGVPELVVASEAAGSVVVLDTGSSFFLTGDVGLRRPGGVRPLALPGVGAGAGVSVLSVDSGIVEGVANGSGVGSGVGAVATSSLASGGSAIRAPTEETRLEPLPREATAD
jgi:hypothetical protein